MNCIVEIKTTLDSVESKAIFKLLGNISVSMEKDCNMNDEEIKLLSEMYENMRQAMSGDDNGNT